MARRVSSSVAPSRTFGQTGSSGLRASAITAQRCAMAMVLSQASGRSANSARIAAAGLNQCSGVTRRRSRSCNWRPSAMHSSASCASCIARVAKKQSLVATSGRPAASASWIRPRLDGALQRKAMTLQFHDAAAGERFREGRKQRLRRVALALGQHPAERPHRAACEQQQSVGVASQRVPACVAGAARGRCRGSRARTGAAHSPGQPRPAPAGQAVRAAGGDCRSAQGRVGSR